MIFDLDGTLYRGDEPIAGAAEALSRLRRDGVAIRFLTNNSGQTRQFYADKLGWMGIEASEAEVYSSATGAAQRLVQDGFRRAFVIGEPGLHATLAGAGIDVQPVQGQTHTAVVVGICKSFSYDLLNESMQFIRAGATFYATNTDASYPLEGGLEIPGAGSLVAAVRTCSGVEPIVVGKPEPFLVEMILRDAGVPPEDALVVGDRPETDLESARRAGCRGLLVLTGVVREPVADWPSLPSVADII